MKKRIAVMSLAAIFAFATIATAQTTTKKAAEPVKKEAKAKAPISNCFFIINK